MEGRREEGRKRERTVRKRMEMAGHSIALVIYIHNPCIYILTSMEAGIHPDGDWSN